MSFFAELKRRNVIRVGIAYVLMGWVALQFADFALDLVDAPNWVIQSLTIILVIGLPFVLFFSWAYELTPEGIKRDADVDRSESIAPQTARKLDRAIIVVLIIAAGYFFWESRFAGDKTGAETPTVASEPTSAEPAERSVAILPFLNMSSDPEQEYFSDGITEEIINAVVKIPGISVPARTSVFGYKGYQGDIREVGLDLGVAYLLEGSVRSQGDQVRVTAQLIKVDDGFHLWSDTFDRKLENIFAVQDEIASAIAKVVVGELGVQAVPNRTRNMEAYDLYLQGRAALRNRQDVAVDLLTQATEADPQFAPAFAALAIAYNSTSIDDVKAIEMAERALVLDPQNVDALNAKGAALRSNREWLEAEQYFDRALAIDPNSAELLEDYAEFLAYVGRVDEALVATTRGVGIDHALIPLAIAHVEALLSNENYNEAHAYLTTLMEERPDLPYLWFLGTPVWLDPEIRAHPDLEPLAPTGTEEAPDSVNVLIEITHRVIAGTATDEDRDLLKSMYTLENIVSSDIDGPVTMLRAPLTVLGETDWVLSTDLELFDISRQPMHEWNWTPVMQPLRQHPDFYRFLERAGLIEYWDASAWPKFCERDDAGVITCQ